MPEYRKYHRKEKTTASVNYLAFEGIQDILARPDQNDRMGRRDLTMLAFLYDSAARVQELADLRVRDVRLIDPVGVNLLGKGSKWRHVQLMEPIAKLLRDYLTENRLTTPDTLDYRFLPTEATRS